MDESESPMSEVRRCWVYKVKMDEGREEMEYGPGIATSSIIPLPSYMIIHQTSSILSVYLHFIL
jgi:hypothetical protein